MQKKLEQLKILIVEDDPISQKVTKELLQKHYSCLVDTAKTATDALDLVNDRSFEWEEKGYHTILMDIYLPDINGDTLTEVIRKTEVQTKSIPIIAISGKVSGKDKKILQDMGITDLLLKPVNFEKMDHMFQKYIKEMESAQT